MNSLIDEEARNQAENAYTILIARGKESLKKHANKLLPELLAEAGTLPFDLHVAEVVCAERAIPRPVSWAQSTAESTLSERLDGFISDSSRTEFLCYYIELMAIVAEGVDDFAAND